MKRTQNTIPYAEALAIACAILGINLKTVQPPIQTEARKEAKRIYKALNQPAATASVNA